MGNENPFGSLLGVGDIALFSDNYSGGLGKQKRLKVGNTSLEATALSPVTGIQDLSQDGSFRNGEGGKSSRRQNQRKLTTARVRGGWPSE